jgi:hypothetical protein
MYISQKALMVLIKWLLRQFSFSLVVLTISIDSIGISNDEATESMNIDIREISVNEGSLIPSVREVTRVKNKYMKIMRKRITK